MTIYRATNGGIVQEKGDVMLREDNSQRYYRIGTWKFYDFDGKLVQELNYD
jgi:hypothetical protein